MIEFKRFLKGKEEATIFFWLTYYNIATEQEINFLASCYDINHEKDLNKEDDRIEILETIAQVKTGGFPEDDEDYNDLLNRWQKKALPVIIQYNRQGKKQENK